MIKQKVVVITNAAGGTVSAGAVGMGFMLQPFARPGSADQPGMFPVRVRLNGDTSRELTILNSQPYFMQSGFTKLEVVEDQAHNAGGHRFLVSVFEVSDDWLGNGDRMPGVLRDPVLGEAPLAVATYRTLDGAQLRPASCHTESGVPCLANGPSDNPDVLRTDLDGRLRVVAETREDLLIDVAFTPADVELLDVGTLYLVPGPNVVTGPALGDATVDVRKYRQIELSVRGGLEKANPANPEPLMAVFLEWVCDGADDAILIDELRACPAANMAEPGTAGAIHLGEGIYEHTGTRVISRGWRPAFVRVRVETNRNCKPAGLRIRLSGRL
ncbi:MAG TPA: hypothetical protein VEU33_28950 [Archangium sp.]|nr:hypothetical protein [Archangium sp.]